MDACVHVVCKLPWRITEVAAMSPANVDELKTVIESRSVSSARILGSNSTFPRGLILHPTPDPFVTRTSLFPYFRNTFPSSHSISSTRFKASFPVSQRLNTPSHPAYPTPDLIVLRPWRSNPLYLWNRQKNCLVLINFIKPTLFL